MNADMKNFNAMVDLAMSNPGLSAMRPVVEKELLHYEIFQALDAEGLLKDLVFQGGTSLRLCRGSDRFSEDLDFAGGVDFTADSMEKIKTCLEKRIGKRFGLTVVVNAKPGKVDAAQHVRVDRWWIAIETTPENPAMPRQKTKLEIANIPAYTRELVQIKANYEVLDGMPTVLVNAESLDEIMADKILAFPTSLLDKQGRKVGADSAKIRHRDIWDLAWLVGRGAKLMPPFVIDKINDYGVVNYPKLLVMAIEEVPHIVESPEFKNQMIRFIDSTTIGRTLNIAGYDKLLATTVGGLFAQMHAALVTAESAAPTPIETKAAPKAVKPTAKPKQKPDLKR